MAMQLYVLVRRPKEGTPEVRGVFTTPAKAENHDVALKGLFTRVREDGRFGWTEVHPESALNHHTVQPYFPNEELDLR